MLYTAPAIDRYRSFVNVPLVILRVSGTNKVLHLPDRKKCWLWTGGKKNGYGAFWFEGKTRLAHRVGWVLKVGNIPNGMMVCHKCDVKLCQNQEHWFLGTAKDNNQDKIEKGRQNLPYGEKHWKVKLTTKQVSEIRYKYSGVYGQVRGLGREYGVSHSTIIGILKNRERLRS